MNFKNEGIKNARPGPRSRGDYSDSAVTCGEAQAYH